MQTGVIAEVLAAARKQFKNRLLHLYVSFPFLSAPISKKGKLNKKPAKGIASDAIQTVIDKCTDPLVGESHASLHTDSD